LGGIDTKKYKGELKSMRGNGYLRPSFVLCFADPYSRLNGLMTDVGITLFNKTSITYDRAIWNKNQTSGFSVLFDSGTIVNLLPNALMLAIGRDYPGAEQFLDGSSGPQFKVPCEAPQGTFDHSFDNTTIRVPFRDALVISESGICTFGFRMNPDNPKIVPYILGASFMKGAYMVFDHDNNERWVAESANCGENIVAVEKGNFGVPMVLGCADGAKPTSVWYAPPPAPTAFN
jgi:hypothetical protein